MTGSVKNSTKQYGALLTIFVAVWTAGTSSSMCLALCSTVTYPKTLPAISMKVSIGILENVRNKAAFHDAKIALGWTEDEESEAV